MKVTAQLKCRRFTEVHTGVLYKIKPAQFKQKQHSNEEQCSIFTEKEVNLKFLFLLTKEMQIKQFQPGVLIKLAFYSKVAFHMHRYGRYSDFIQEVGFEIFNRTTQLLK